MDRLQQDGVVPGFFYYPLDVVDRKDILGLRDRLEDADSRSGRGGGRHLYRWGHRTTLGYLDFISWDLKALLDSAVEVFSSAPLAWAAFHTFRADADSIGLKQRLV